MPLPPISFFFPLSMLSFFQHQSFSTSGHFTTFALTDVAPFFLHFFFLSLAFHRIDELYADILSRRCRAVRVA